MMKKMRTDGFSVIGLILIIVTIAAVSGGGWYVWQKNAEPNKANNASSASNNQNNPTEEDQYLVIKEWDLKIPLSKDIAEAYYEFRSDDTVEYVQLFDAGFDKLKNTNGMSCGGSNKFQFYSISRVKTSNVGSLTEPTKSQYQKFAFTDEWMFRGIGAHQAPPPCSSLSSDPSQPYKEDTNILDIADNKEKAFDSAFKDLQPAD